MIYNKQFTREDLEFFLNTFDVSEAFFSFIMEESEPEIVDVAKQIDPDLMIFAAIVPTLSKENFLSGIESLTAASDETVDILSNNYSAVRFEREDFRNEKAFKDFIQAHPYSHIAFRMLSDGKFDEEFLLNLATKYVKNYEGATSFSALLRISFNSSFSREGREKLFSILDESELRVSYLIFNSSLEDEDEFMKFYEKLPDQQKKLALSNPKCPPLIRELFLESEDWEAFWKLSMSSSLTGSEVAKLASWIMKGCEANPGENELEFENALHTFLENFEIPITVFRAVVEKDIILKRKDLHSIILTAIARRIHEDISLYRIAHKIMSSYELKPIEAPEILRDPNSDPTSMLEDLNISINNMVTFYYTLLRNVNTPTEILETINTQGTPGGEAISLTMLPHPNLGEVQAAEILDRVIGTPFEQIALLHIRNPEVMKLVEHRYGELSYRSKLAIILNPKVHGETYLALALQEQDAYVKELLMRAGAEAHVKHNIGGLLLTELSSAGLLEAWKGSGGDPTSTKTKYAEFTVAR